MVCLDYFVRTPAMAALTGAVLTLIYFLLTSFSTTLPPALLSSIVVGYFIFISMGGKLLCGPHAETKEPDVVVRQVQPPQPSMEKAAVENAQRLETRL
jgi:hypothetical protein